MLVSCSVCLYYAGLWIRENVPLFSCPWEAAQMFSCLTEMKQNSVFDVTPASLLHLNVCFSLPFLLVSPDNKVE